MNTTTITIGPKACLPARQAPEMPATRASLPPRVGSTKFKLLAIVDSPTRNTGFACVGKNLLPLWQPHFERIDVWGINHDGWPHEFPWRIFPGGMDFSDNEKRVRLLNGIIDSDYTHVWVLNDSFVLSRDGFAQNLRLACDTSASRPKLVVYFPVDASQEKSWMRIARVADAAVTYTDYGVEQVLHADPDVKNLSVIPHGVDTKVFRPLGERERIALREEFFPDWKPSDVVLVNVNRNERRKGMVHSLQVLMELKALGVPAKLHLHTPIKNGNEQIDLRRVAEQIGVSPEDWQTTGDAVFEGGVGLFPESRLNELYNAADFCLSTSYGEGWGFSLTEAAAAGIQVVCPAHTSCEEIAHHFDVHGRCKQFVLAPLSRSAVTNVSDNSRVRFPIDPVEAAMRISLQPRQKFPPLDGMLKEWLSWERIAEAWMEVFQSVKSESVNQ